MQKKFNPKISNFVFYINYNFERFIMKKIIQCVPEILEDKTKELLKQLQLVPKIQWCGSSRRRPGIFFYASDGL